jgi:hypothetical protein
MRYHACPVCGFGRLPRPLEDFDICPCCGTEFGYDDCTISHEELRRRWIKAGANWWSETTQPPTEWNPIIQLLEAKILPVELSASNDGSTETTTSFVGWGFYQQLDARLA